MSHAITREQSSPTDASERAHSPSSAPHPQRMLYVVSIFPALSETFIVREVQALVDLGVDVRILSLRPQRHVIEYPQAEALLERAIRPASFLRNATAMWALLTQQPRQVIGFQWTVFTEMWRNPLELGKTMVALWRAAGHAARTRDFRPQLVHAAWATYPATAAWFLSRLMECPFSFTSRAHDIFEHDHMMRSKLAHAALAVTITQHNVRYMAKWMPRPGAVPVHVIHSSLNLPDTTFVRHSRETAELLAVGRLVPMKGFHVLLDAVASLRDRGVRVHCTIIGDGPERQRLLRQRSALGLDGQVELTGALPQSAVKRHMATATLLVMPCIVTRQGSADGIPNVLMEAMASGLPVISTTISGIPELVEDGLNGRLIEPGDPELLGDAIVELLADAARQERFASAGRHKVEREFNIRVEAGRLLDHFGKACNA